MHIVLLVLKVLGITLLIILGLILLLVLLLLVAPFTYQIDGSYHEDPRASIRIRWLAFVIDLKGCYQEQKFLYYLKSFGFMVSTNDENNKHYKPPAEEEEDFTSVPTTVLPNLEDELDAFDKEQEAEGALVPAEVTGTDPEGAETSGTLPAVSEDELPTVVEEQLPAPGEEGGWFHPLEWLGDKIQNGLSKFTDALSHSVESMVEHVTSFFEKINLFFDELPEKIHNKIGEISFKTIDFLVNIKDNINQLLKKKDFILKKYRQVRKLLDKDYTKKFLSNLKKFCMKAVKHVRPRKLKGDIRFGLEDPAQTGQMLGAVSLLIPIYKKGLRIHPNFNEKEFEGDISIKGRVIVGVMALLAIRYFVNLNTYKTVRAVMKIMNTPKKKAK